MYMYIYIYIYIYKGDTYIHRYNTFCFIREMGGARRSSGS